MNNFSTDSNDNNARKQYKIGGKRRQNWPLNSFEQTPESLIGYVPNCLPSQLESLDTIAFSLQRIADALDKIAGFDSND